MPCSDAYLENFFPVESKSAELPYFDEVKGDRKLFCIDWENEDVDLYGDESTEIFGIVEIVVVPCNQNLT